MPSIGDVLVTRSRKGWAGRLIRFGACLRDQANLWNHVAVIHHIDQAGTAWAVEGRPGGVGWVDARKYLTDPYTISNSQQPRTPEQRVLIVTVVEAMLGTAYDWQGIAGDAALAIGMPALFAEKWDGKVPGHVVCSSLADWAYEHSGLPSPGVHDTRHTTPADWAQLIVEHRWQ